MRPRQRHPVGVAHLKVKVQPRSPADGKVLAGVRIRNGVSAGARLDRLPVGAFHRRVMWLVGLGYFFDSFDNTLSASVLASMLNTHWSTLELNSVFMSATFAGLTIEQRSPVCSATVMVACSRYQFNLAIFGGLSLLCAFAPTMAMAGCASLRDGHRDRR